MPIYDYECSDCRNQFDETLRMSERLGPTEDPCEKCGGVVKQTITQMSIGDPVRLGIIRPGVQFNEVLSKIHERTVGSNLNQKMSRNPVKKIGL